MLITMILISVAIVPALLGNAFSPNAEHPWNKYWFFFVTHNIEVGAAAMLIVGVVKGQEISRKANVSRCTLKACF